MKKSVYNNLRLCAFISLSILVPGLCGIATAYEYPIQNPYLATIVGTPPDLKADFPEDVPFESRSLKVFDERHVPEVLWYNKSLHYSVVRQKGSAPLVFAIAGTGADHDSEKNLALLSAFYQAGFHAVGLTSPTHSNFITAASSTGVPGHLHYDAKDLYHVMQRVRDDIKDKTEITEFYLIGYSLGGTQAAFVAKTDQEQQIFDFKKVLMVNPSLSLYSSVSKLDRMLENIPGGMDHFNEYFEMLIQRASKYYKRSDVVDFNDEYIYKAFQEEQPKDEELAAIIGVAFRLASANMIFTSDIMTNFGFIKPSNHILNKTTSLKSYLRISMRLGFTDYYHEYLFPFFLQKDPSLTRESFADMLSLKHIERFLRRSKHIGIVHNEDDIILAKGEVDYFRELFNEQDGRSDPEGVARAVIYPRGGHMGNLFYPDTMNFIMEFFKQ